MKRIAWVTLGCLMFVSANLYAGDSALADIKPDISNIGFIENPPKELKEKFPMCDAFLKIKWIDKDRKVGYSEYEFYNQGEKVKRVAHALVYLDDDHPVFDVNLDEFRKNGKLKDVFELIELGDFEPQDPQFGLKLYAERNGINYGYEFSSIRSDWQMPLLTLADNKLNVCIPYPDNQRMYFAEQQKVGKVYSNNEIDGKRVELKQWIANLSFFDQYTPMDLNFDGKEDYLTEDYLTGTSFIYSHEGKYLEMKIIETSDSPNSKLTSPTTGKSCEFRHLWGDHYFTTEGKYVFIDNQCNLTELTLPSTQEK